MINRPDCNFCKSKSDIYETQNSNKIYYCAKCYLKIKPKYEANTRPRDQRISR